MRWTYDPSVEALSVRLAPGQSEHQVELAPGVIADVAASGVLLGLEVLNRSAVDLDVIASRFELDSNTKDSLREIVFQPATVPSGESLTNNSSRTALVA
jgi:hypothetical protein